VFYFKTNVMVIIMLEINHSMAFPFCVVCVCTLSECVRDYMSIYGVCVSRMCAMVEFVSHLWHV
jgi:hypothetical protein